MLSKEEYARYSKQIILPEIKIEGQEKLMAARVLVVGAGGLGCPVLQYLTASGVGNIGIADGDNIDISNLQRQVLYTEAEIGQSKALTAQKKLQALNPNVTIHVHRLFIDSSNALDILDQYDIIVDGSDNFDTRYLINDACIILNKPMVSGAIYKFEGQVSVFNYHHGPTYRCIFPEPPAPEDSPNCAEIGVIASLPGIIGSIQANEVIKLITGIGEVLSGRLMVIDTLTMHTHFFQFKLNPANRSIKELTPTLQQCAVNMRSITYSELGTAMQQNPQIQLVDVREPEEHEISNIGGINIPLSTFATGATQLDPAKPVILYCASGVRSNKAAQLLLQQGFKNVTNLSGGIKDLEGTW